MTTYTCLLVLLAVSPTNSANILGLFLVNARSHFIIYQPLLEKLAEKGHQVDVLSHFPREKSLPRYTDLSVNGSTTPIDINVQEIRKNTLLKHLYLIYDICGYNLCESVCDTAVAKKLRNSTKHYDLIVTEIFFSDCLLGYAKIHNAPIVAFITSTSIPWASSFIGLPDNPSYIPHYFSRYTTDMTFLERMHNAFQLLLLKFWYHNYAMERSNEHYQKFFGINNLHLKKLVNNISLVMVNTHFTLYGSKPTLPNYIEVGGMHIRENSVLPKDFEKHLQTDLQGIIYVSFGTVVRSEAFPEDIILSFFEVLERTPYKVLWKGNSSDIPNHIRVPKNIEFIKWLPQLELLCHPNTRLFITHCGLASVFESTYCGTPILGIPIWADQLSNANVAIIRGTGIVIPLFEITKEKFSESLWKMLKDPKYARNAKRLSELFRDRPLSPLDTAVYWTEYVIKYKGAPHLRSRGADLPWYSYYCLDIVLLPFIILFLICGILSNLYKNRRGNVKHKTQ